MNVGKSKVMRCSRYENVGRKHVRLNREPFEVDDCFKYRCQGFIFLMPPVGHYLHQMNLICYIPDAASRPLFTSNEPDLLYS